METVVIVGGTSGMGYASATLFATKGFRVIVTGRSEARAKEAASSIRFALGEAADVNGVALDFTEQSSVDNVFSGIGPIDHLVLVGSGFPARGQFRDLDAEAFLVALNQKIVGYHRCLRSALQSLRYDGSVAVVTGGASRATIPGTSLVAGINAGIQAWALVLAKELAPLRVNVLSPGFIDTPLHDWQSSENKQKLFDRLVSGIPVGRIGKPEEVADAIMFLTTNKYVSGAVLDIDGGVRLR